MLANVSPSVGVQLLFGALLVGLIACLALEEKLHAKKSVIVGLFAVVCLLMGEAFHLLPTREVVVGSHLVDSSEQAVEDANLSDELHEGGHEIVMPVYIPAIDWSVIVILLGSSVFVDVISRSGLFKWLAIKVTKLSRGDPSAAVELLRRDDSGVFRRVEQCDGDDNCRFAYGCVARQTGSQG